MNLHECKGCGVRYPTEQGATECAESHKKLEYTYDHLEAGACMWEHVLERIQRHKGGLNPWLEFREAYGAASLRAAVIRHAPQLQEAYERACDNGYNEPFDWEFVPKYMEDHVTRILT
jgi:hypothetical protein